MSDLSQVVRQGFGYYFHDFLMKVQTIAGDLSEQEFWTNPYPYGNSIGHLVLHITGNLKYYIGTQLAAMEYVRDRALEFTDPAPSSKEEALRELTVAVNTVIVTLEKQADSDWGAVYRAEGVDDVADRFSIFLRCAVHFHHHIGHMSYTKDELLRKQMLSDTY
jgi:hypothetical protein